jgi:hypothetical protein
VKTYEAVSYWADAVRSSVSEGEDDYVVELLRSYDLSTCDGVRDLSAFGISQLQNNRTLTTQNAIDLWQVSQMLKKFSYGCTASPEEMQSGWIERNAKCALPYQGPSWVLARVAAKLAPLGPAFEATEANGRFGNGAVYEGITPFARWNASQAFSYDVRSPDSVRWWSPSPWDSARLSCVPKDMFKLRSITVEPSEATFLQQLYRTRLIAAAASVLPKSSAVPDQLWGGGPQRQRIRALRGSLDGKTATLDLSDASDSVRWDVVSMVFPPNIVAALERARSPYCEVGESTKRTRYRVHMYAGMGNATTFIVETLFFWALCTVLSEWVRDFTPVSVFGDDIVCGIKAANHPLFHEQLSLAGLSLNMAKSGLSVEPGFREACGLAAFAGCELPLLRIKGYDCRKPEELVSLCSMVNAALARDSRYAPFVRRFGERVGSDIRNDFECPLLPCEPLRPGVYLVDPDMAIGEWSYRSRWDDKSQHPEIRCRVLEADRGKTLRFRNLTNGEALGVLNGQLQTDFRMSEKAGFSARLTSFTIPSGKMKLSSTWNPVWSTGRELCDLVSAE